MLSTDTGFHRDYRRSPYLDYARSSRPMFPVANKSREYRNKDLVLGVSLDGITKAYPFKELSEHGRSRFEDRIGPIRVTVEWFAADEFARILDVEGRELPSVIAYWFAWYAFHPGTQVFRAVETAE